MPILSFLLALDARARARARARRTLRSKISVKCPNLLAAVSLLSSDVGLPVSNLRHMAPAAKRLFSPSRPSFCWACTCEACARVRWLCSRLQGQRPVSVLDTRYGFFLQIEAACRSAENCGGGSADAASGRIANEPREGECGRGE